MPSFDGFSEYDKAYFACQFVVRIAVATANRRYKPPAAMGRARGREPVIAQDYTAGEYVCIIYISNNRIKFRRNYWVEFFASLGVHVVLVQHDHHHEP